ncbi:hypothetical protein [Paenibacillus polymyxa]|uniref:hypothetical protein n=1 Tax=Paenibacillus polymyxa TaxID=1406 RepID=UPI00083CB2C0|nr:hypothetical protein [Paenibacillus polymyxa]ODB61350.1 hypothetical protein A7309_14985 [Paenibacillus polymyxa]
MTTYHNIFRWHIKRARITGDSTAVIDIYIPGVNQQDRVDIRLNLIDRLRGIDIEKKTLRTLDEWEQICQEQNGELDRAEERSRRLSDSTSKPPSSPGLRIQKPG